MRIMALFQKHYFSLNNSVSKNILVCLSRKDAKFSAALHLFGEKDGLVFDLKQYTAFVKEKNSALAFFDGGASAFEFCVSNKENELQVSGRKGHCVMLMMRQVEKISGRVSVVCIAKNTFERLMELDKLIMHLMTRMDKSVPECEMLLKKEHNIDELGINEHGLDLYALDMELNLFESGVKDSIFKS